jgi:hypothetical protein
MGSILKYAALALGVYLVWKSGLVQNLMASITGGAASAGGTTGSTGAGTQTTGGGGSTDTGSGTGNTPCAAVQVTCSDGSKVSLTPGNAPTCTLDAATSAAACSTKPADVLALAQGLDARARSDGLSKGTTISPAATGWPAGQVLYSVWQWNYVMKELHPGAKDYNSKDNSRAMPATQYVTERAPSLGLSGLGALVHSMRGHATVRVPMTPDLARALALRSAQGDLMAAIQIAKAGGRAPVPMHGARLNLRGLALGVR